MQPFSRAICLFWHGIFGGKKYPVAFYSKKERQALANEVAAAAKKYAQQGKMESAGRLSRYFEFITAFINAKNLFPNSNFPEKNVLSAFLKLLYHGKNPHSFWIYFRKKYHLPLRPAANAFWDNFEEFQPRRMEIAGWLGKHAKGKLLDIGAGEYSYIPVDVALDASSAALRKNKNAKIKIAFDLNKKSRLPFASNSFGTVMLNSILAYSAKPQALLGECKRILKPNGLLLITNALVNDYHPAKYFERNKISKRNLAILLKGVGFEYGDDSIRGIILVPARRA